MTKGQMDKWTKLLKGYYSKEKIGKGTKGQKKKDKGTNKNAKMHKLTCGERGWRNISTKGRLCEKYNKQV